MPRAGARQSDGVLKKPVHGRLGRRTAVERLSEMSNFVDERRYAWRMMRAARHAQANSMRVDGAMVCRDEIVTLLDQALDAGLDRAELIVELANLGARFFALCDLDGQEAIDFAAEDAAICLN